MAKPDLDTEALRKKLLELPQEIWDMIYEFTFTAPSGGIRSITNDTRSEGLNLLHVSRETRARYAKLYYHAVWALDYDVDLFKWLRSLTKHIEIS